MDSLGLSGQRKLLNPETATRNPYRVMEKQEQLVYGALLTEHVALENYDADTIPLRVLQVAAHAKETGLFDRLEVWYPESAVVRDDPILVGFVKKSDGYSFFLHILARWGKCLKPLEQLEALAVDQARKAAVNAIEEIQNQLERRLDIVKSTNNLKTLSHRLSYYDMES